MLDVEVASIASGGDKVVKRKGVVPRGVVSERIELVIGPGDIQRVGRGGGLRGGNHTVLATAGGVTPGRPGRTGLCQMAAGSVGVEVVTEDNRLREHPRCRRKQ